MRSLRAVYGVASLTLPLTLVACSGGSSSNDRSDASVDRVDAQVDAPVDSAPDAPTPCTISSASFGSLDALTGPATLDTRDTPNVTTDDLLTFDAALEPEAPFDIFRVELYAGFGVFSGGAIVPGTYQLTGSELDLETCGVCVRILTNMAGPNSYDDDYMATGGSVTISTAGPDVGGTITGTVSNLTFRHVNVAPSSLTTTLANDSCATTITAASFGATLVAAP